MKKFLLEIAGLLFAVSAFALPTHRELPENLALLTVCERTENGFSAILNEIWYQSWATNPPMAILNVGNLPDAKAKLESMGVLEVANRMRSLTVAATRNNQHLPDGFILLADGDFDAPLFMRRLIDSEIVQKGGAQGFTVKVSGESVVLALNAPNPGYPPLGKGFELTLEAVTPNTIRLASSGVRAALAAGKTLPPESPYAPLLIPGGLPQRTRIAGFNTTLTALGTLIPEKAKDSVMMNPVWELFSGVEEIEWGNRAVSDAEMLSEVRFNLVSPENAQPLQELLIGYKVLATTFLANGPPMLITLKHILSKAQVTVSESAVILSIPATADQMAKLYEFMGIRFVGLDGNLEMLGGMEPLILFLLIFNA